jgi:hypothetical protein
MGLAARVSVTGRSWERIGDAYLDLGQEILRATAVLPAASGLTLPQAG